jgi:DNA-directed RNA polymerase subunit RPC12/RpoP
MMASEQDPHGIVPNSFWEMYDSLREAEREPTTTDTDTLPRCPDCRSHCIRQKPDTIADQPRAKEGDYKCKNCLNQFNSPLPPKKEQEGSE